MKRIICLLTCLALMLSTASISAFAAQPTDFTDLPATDSWAYPGIVYCIEKGYMNGIDEETFSPGSPVTRGQLVTILYRIEGEPEVSFRGIFSDVSQDAYYAMAVEWAYANAIVFGVDLTHFAPNDPITRQQIAAIVHRYCGAPLTGISLDAFADAGDCQLYGMVPMSWCVEMGLINGMTESGETYLRPQSHASREQIAAILMRLMENVVNQPQEPEENEPADDYLQAYAAMLENELDAGRLLSRFALVNIDGDEIPELVVNPGWAAPTVYTFQEGSTVALGSFGSIGSFQYVHLGNRIRSESMTMGRTVNGFYTIEGGQVICTDLFEDNRYELLNQDKYFKINEEAVTQEVYEQRLEDLVQASQWSAVTYESCHNVTHDQIEAFTSNPEDYILNP